MILILAVAFIFCGVSFLVGLSFIVESARENIEHDKPCKSYQLLKWTSLFSKESKHLLGSLYSKGICPAQDISKAKDLYASVYGHDSGSVARALFHDAIQLSDLYERNEKDEKPENVHALLIESKKMRFKPTDMELIGLDERNLRKVFTENP